MAAFARETRGAEVVEFALVLPLLLFLIAGIIDMGFLFNNYETLTNAAREGARVAIVPGATDLDVETRVKQYVQADGMNAGAVSTTITPVQIALPGGLINGVKVTVAYPYNYMVLGPIAKMVQSANTFDTVTITAAATMRTELTAGL
ncbi:MAG: TadE/TadG family type IV pilus assembly protein [Candidatus Dormibacteria bacterium]